MSIFCMNIFWTAAALMVYISAIVAVTEWLEKKGYSRLCAIALALIWPGVLLVTVARDIIEVMY